MSVSRRYTSEDTVYDPPPPPDMFELESEVFKSMFEIPQGADAEGETDESPIVLPSVSVPEMEALLTFFYFR